MQADSYKFIPYGTPDVPPPPPPDPLVLAREAVGRLTVPDPVVHFGPDDQQIAVNLPTWLWVDDPGARSVTVTAGAVSVTATAELAGTRWSMGEPVDVARPAVLADPLECAGAGSEPPPTWTRTVPAGACGYVYQWRSLKERTDGVGAWPVAVTATWTVSWQASTGQRGTETLTARTDTSARVGEFRIALVDGGG